MPKNQPNFAVDHPYIIGIVCLSLGGVLLWHVLDVLTAVHNHSSFYPLGSGASCICIIALSIGLTLLLGGSGAAKLMVNYEPVPKLDKSLWCIFYWSLILIPAISFDVWVKSEIQGVKAQAPFSKMLNVQTVSTSQPILTGDVSGCLLTVSVSTDDSVQGTSLGSHSWGQDGNNMHFSCALTPGVKNYLHILVQPPSNSRVFFGYFTVSGGPKFARTSSTILDSRPESWQVSLNGWGNGYRTPAVAPNSKAYTSQDSTVDQEDPNAQTLMDPVAGVDGKQNVYFSTLINPAVGGDKSLATNSLPAVVSAPTNSSGAAENRASAIGRLVGSIIGGGIALLAFFNLRRKLNK